MAPQLDTLDMDDSNSVEGQIAKKSTVYLDVNGKPFIVINHNDVFGLMGQFQNELISQIEKHLHILETKSVNELNK